MKKPTSLINLNKYFFSEDQSRYIVEINEKNKEKVLNTLNKRSIFFENIGRSQKKHIFLQDEFDITVEEVSKLYNNWFEKYLI